MAHGTLREFDATKESIEDFCHRLEFYCLANNIKDGDEAQQNQKKALFVTLVGQTTFAKLRDLASPREITDLTGRYYGVVTNPLLAPNCGDS